MEVGRSGVLLLLTKFFRFVFFFLLAFGIIINLTAAPVLADFKHTPSAERSILLSYSEKIFFKWIVARVKATPEQVKSLTQSLKTFYYSNQLENAFLQMSREERLAYQEAHPDEPILVITKPEQIFEARKDLYRSPVASHSIYSELEIAAQNPILEKFHKVAIDENETLRKEELEQFKANQREFFKIFRGLHWGLFQDTVQPEKITDWSGWKKEFNLLKKLTPLDFERFLNDRSVEFRSFLTGFVGSSELQDMDPAIAKFMEKTFSFYFENLGLDSKKLIISDWITQDFTKDPEKIIEIMIQNAGPHFQKLVQALVKEKGLPKRLERIFKKIESAVKPVPAELAKQIIDAEAESYNITEYRLKPLGTGSMAQIHVGKYNQFYDIAIRYLKPGIQLRAEEDHRILKKLALEIDSNPEFQKAGVPKISFLIDDIHFSVMEELDLAKTVDNQMLARKVYHQKTFQAESLLVQFQVPWIMKYRQGTKIIIQEKVKGTSLDKIAEKYKDTLPNLKTEVTESLARLWIDEVLYGSGFYHADPHQGNFLVDVVTKNGLPNKVMVNLLDYGMAGHISAAQQNLILTLGIAVEIRKLDLIVNSLWDLTIKKDNGITKGEFRMYVARLLASVKKNQKNSMHEGGNPMTQDLAIDDFVKLGIEKGLHFQNNFLNLNRGLILIDKMLIETNSKERVKSLGISMALKHKNALVQLLLNIEGLEWSEAFGLVKKQLQSRPSESNNLNEKSPASTLPGASAKMAASENSMEVPVVSYIKQMETPICSGIYR